MLEGNFAEAETKRVAIEDATFDEFSGFLEALVRNGEITGRSSPPHDNILCISTLIENLESLHRLAYKYDTKELTLRCRTFVWTTDKMELLQKFTRAEAWEDDVLLVPPQLFYRL